MAYFAEDDILTLLEDDDYDEDYESFIEEEDDDDDEAFFDDDDDEAFFDDDDDDDDEAFFDDRMESDAERRYFPRYRRRKRIRRPRYKYYAPSSRRRRFYTGRGVRHATIGTPRGQARIKLPVAVVKKSELKLALKQVRGEIKKNSRAIRGNDLYSKRINRYHRRRVSALKNNLSVYEKKMNKKVASLEQQAMIQMIFNPPDLKSNSGKGTDNNMLPLLMMSGGLGGMMDSSSGNNDSNNLISMMLMAKIFENQS